MKISWKSFVVSDAQYIAAPDIETFNKSHLPRVPELRAINDTMGTIIEKTGLRFLTYDPATPVVDGLPEGTKLMQCSHDKRARLRLSSENTLKISQGTRSICITFA